jgi:hypothetical protein
MNVRLVDKNARFGHHITGDRVHIIANSKHHDRSVCEGKTMQTIYKEGYSMPMEHICRYCRMYYNGKLQEVV